MRARTVLLLLLAVASVGVLGTWRRATAEDARRQDAIETSRLRRWARSEGGAGPSVEPIKRLAEAEDRDLRELKRLPGFHEYAVRCSSCHAFPDPAADPAGQWYGKVDEMREHVRRAGVVPPAESELEAARRFLSAASDSLRDD